MKLKKICPAYCQFRPDGDGFRSKHLILKKENVSIRSKQNISAYDLNKGSQHMILTEDLSIRSEPRISAYDLN